MKLNKTIGLFAALLVSVMTQAEEQKHMRLEIAVDKGVESTQEFYFDSDQAGIDLQQMQLGESQSIIDSNGNATLVTRTEHGFQFDVGGETIDVMDHPDEHGFAVVEETENVGGEVRVIRKMKKIKLDNDAAIVHGHTDHDHETLHSDEEHKVYIIKKEVDVAN